MSKSLEDKLKEFKPDAKPEEVEAAVRLCNALGIKDEEKPDIQPKLQTGMQQETRTIANHFYNCQRKYYRNEMNDEQLTEVTTQPFWQSMRLSKRRLTEKGLTMDVSIVEKNDSGKRNVPRMTTVRKDGSDYIGNYNKSVVTERSYFHNGRKIHNKKEHELCSVNVLKSQVDGENAACPNCGNVGKISSYIDGCDYCGSKFTVHDFEPKISGFALEEDISKKIKGTLLKTVAALAVFSGIMIILTIISMFAFVILGSTGGNVKGMLMSMISFEAGIVSVPVIRNTIFMLGIIYLVLGNVLLAVYPTQIKGKDVVNRVLPNFSFQDFFQNLEYKLRNIHLTDRPQEVNGFASFDLGPIVSNYKDVVDCQLRTIKFCAIRPTNERYELDLEASLKLSVFDGMKICTKYENANLTVCGTHEMLSRNATAIREHKCPNCAASVNLLEGGSCAYCGSKLDYENYGWKLLKYRNKMQRFQNYTWIRLVMIALYILVIAFNATHVEKTGDNLWEVLDEVNRMEEAVIEYFDEVPTLEMAGNNVTLISRKDEWGYRSYSYSVTYGATLAENYKNLLLKDGFMPYEEEASEYAYYLYKVIEFEGEYAYLRVGVSVEETKIQVVYSVIDDME